MGKHDALNEKAESAGRLRQIRENAGLTQEQFAEVMGISVSAYKKVEGGENNISLPSLKKLHKKMRVSSDYILYGKNENADEIWTNLLNCSDTDKMVVMLKLLKYFIGMKKRMYPMAEETEQADEVREITDFIQKLSGTE